MPKDRILKIVGVISDEIVDKYKLYNYRNETIVQSLDLYKHIEKHIHEFKSIDSYKNTINNISNIIGEPEFVYYYKNKNSLLYFKEIEENVCIVVKLKLRKNKETYISTIYPISKNKINRYIEMSYIVNR